MLVSCAVLGAIAAACIRLAYVAPLSRLQETQAAAVVRIGVSCVDHGPQDLSAVAVRPADDGAIMWRPYAEGTGVVVTERHVLTAAHVVDCPVPPAVTLLLADGRRFSAVVVRDDARFGDGRDVALLEIATAERFGLGIAPPNVGALAGELCLSLARGRTCGERAPVDSTTRGVVVIDAATRHGDSGAGVYNADGELAGIVVSSGTADAHEYTGVLPVTLADVRP